MSLLKTAAQVAKTTPATPCDTGDGSGLKQKCRNVIVESAKLIKERSVNGQVQEVLSPLGVGSPGVHAHGDGV